uniref:CCHC-type domain-containing protein n=1 Tax=Xenopus tropicalis TaxID=8364 RepID=A0A803JWH1_XENTR
MESDLFDDGISHPQSNFRMGAERGFMFYSGMPKYCQRCNEFGHIPQDCEAGIRMCGNCLEFGHITKDCKSEKKCSLCKELGHMYRECPERGMDYAGAVKGGKQPSVEAGGEERVAWQKQKRSFLPLKISL